MSHGPERTHAPLRRTATVTAPPPQLDAFQSNRGHRQLHGNGPECRADLVFRTRHSGDATARRTRAFDDEDAAVAVTAPPREGLEALQQAGR